MHHHPEIERSASPGAPRTNGALTALTVAEIDLAVLRHNVSVLRGLAGAASIVGVVKADAYGHGALPITQELARSGVERFAVATLAEAIELREAGIEKPILVFTSALPDRLPLYARHRLGATVASMEVVDAVAGMAGSGAPLEVHLKIDTGMGRIGIRPDEAPRAAARLMAAAGVELTSVWTHLATSDDPEPAFVEQQLERFDRATRSFRDDVPFTHIGNSGALLNHWSLLELNERTWVRPGIALYGLSPSADDDQAADAGLQPVMQLRSTVTHVKDVEHGTPISYSRRYAARGRRRIATVAAGYADGFPRNLTNRGMASIGGEHFPIAGTVCMDMMMVDLGPADSAPDVAPGHDVVLFGSGGPSCFDVARAAGTITYEITCRVSRRVPRLYRT